MSLRQIRDANLIQSVNLPAAGASAVTPAINVGTGPHTEIIEVRVEVEAIGNLADDKNLVVILEDSDTEDAGFGTVEQYAAQTLLGAGGIGHVALLSEFRLPADIKPFIRAKATLDALGGNLTDQELTLTILV